MRRKIFKDYLPVSTGPLKILLADIYLSLGGVSKNLYLVGGLVPEFLVTKKCLQIRLAEIQRGGKGNDAQLPFREIWDFKESDKMPFMHWDYKEK